VLLGAAVADGRAGVSSEVDTDTDRKSRTRPLAGFGGLAFLVWSCGGLALLTLFWPDWIERLTGYDPDQHEGSVEWLIMIAILSTAPFWRSRRVQDDADSDPEI
jgi:hypothetical protein